MKVISHDCRACASPCCRAPMAAILRPEEIGHYTETRAGRFHVLRQNEDGGDCCYLDPETGLCSIYSTRPMACREFQCLPTEERISNAQRYCEQEPGRVIVEMTTAELLELEGES